MIFYLAILIWTIIAACAAKFLLQPAVGFANSEWTKMVVIHVPFAMMAVVSYIISAFYAVKYLIIRNLKQDNKSASASLMGFIFTVLATLSGMIFAYYQWGSAWNWDPRETSILILFCVYSAYFSLRSSISNKQTKARISAVYNLMAVLIMPYLVFVLPRIMPGLHPENTLIQKQGLSSIYRIIMFCVFTGYFGILCFYMRSKK